MDQKSVSAAVLLVAAGAFYPRTASRSAAPPTPPNAPGSPASQVTKSSTQSGEGTWTPICDHFLRKPQGDAAPQTVKIDIQAEDPKKGFKAEIQGSVKSTGTAPTLAQQYCVPLADGVKFRTMIVLAPDPELTHLSLDFDRTIESIVWAVNDARGDEDAAFTLESYWFPWQKPPEKEETDPDKRKLLKQDQNERLSKAGMLLFRGRGAFASQLLAVFVVGDRPDFGPSRIQFQAALDGIRVLQNNICLDVPIVGPSFSGSIQPLQSLIAANDCDEFFVVTGRATNQDAVAGFSGNHTNPPALCSTVENDRSALEAFKNYASRWSPQLAAQTALLNEDETLYGSDNSKLAPDDPRLGMVQFRFPRGISRLRNNVEELPGLNAPTTNSNTGYQALPLILKEPGQDTIRSYSEQLTPVSSEAVLLNIAASLRRMRIHYAGILATDPLDALFLARFLRIAAPDIRLFLLEPDALFAREAHNWDLEGVVTITNYPLVLENQYSNDPPRRISFASGYEEATYNACRRVMFRWTDEETGLSCDAGSSRNRGNGELIEYQPPFSLKPGPDLRTKPALWVTVLGHDSFWPVAALDSNRSTLLKGPPPQGPRKSFDGGPEPFIWRVLFLSLLAFSSFHLIFVGLNALPFRDYTFFKAIIRYNPVRNFRIRPGSPFIGGQAASMAMMYVALALANAVFLMAAGTFRWHAELWLSALFLIIFLAVAIWMTAKAILNRENWFGSPQLAVLPWIFGLICVFCLLPLWKHSEQSHQSFFFVYRSVHIDNGVSPAAPLLILAAGFYYWAWIQTRRFRLADELRPEVPATVNAPKNFMGEIHGIFGKRAVLLFGLLTTIFFLIFCPFIYVHTVEGSGYDDLVAAALLAIYAMLIGSLVRFVTLWRDLRTILQFLERHPLREAFSRLPHTFSWTSIWQGDLRPTFVTTTRSRDCLRRLDPALNTAVDRIVKYIEKTQANKVFQFEQAYFDSRTHLERLYKHSADHLRDQLQPVWQQGTSDSIEDARKRSINPERSNPPAGEDEKFQWFAEEFLALQYVTLIRYAFFQMRNFLEYVTGGFILMVMAVYVYPFEDHRLLGAANITMFALLAAGMLMVFAQMDRDPILSRLSATKPQLDMNFVWRVVSYGSLPVLALLGSQFPTIGNFLFSWVQPALQSIK